jgi:hypothetical protein
MIRELKLNIVNHQEQVKISFIQICILKKFDQIQNTLQVKYLQDISSRVAMGIKVTMKNFLSAINL